MKVNPPATTSWRVDRPRIERRLDETLSDAVRLTLVSAPPGYGKSEAVAGWVRARSLPVAWLSLDAGDDDLGRFVHYLAAALAVERPEARRVVLAAAADVRPTPDLLAALFLEAIELTDRALVLVLDDYQSITSPAVHSLVRALVAHAPPFLHPVVVSREDPPLPLARLRARRELVEIRARELRFGPDEARALLEAGGAGLDDVTLERLLVRTEGWAAGLQLAAVALRGRPDVDAAVAALVDSRRFVFDYLADEVVTGLPVDLRDLLVRTSAVDRFSVELCAELSGRRDAAALLAEAERRNLLVARLDDDGPWFRYHPLLADYLRSLLEPGERRELEARASAWFASAGLGDEAITLALAAGRDEDAGRLVRSHARATFEAGEIETVVRWLDALAPDAVAADADLVALRAVTLFYAGRLGDALRIAVEHPPSDPPGPADGRLLALRALIGTTTDASAEATGRAGLKLVGDDPLFRALALEAIGLARLARGDPHGAVAVLRDAFAEARRSGAPLAVLPAVNPLCHGLQALGRRDEAEALARQVLAEFAGPAGRPLPITWSARLVLGIARYEADDVVEASSELEAGLQSATALGVGRGVLGWALPYVALARAATGDSEAALAILRPSTADQATTGLVLPSLAAETEARIRLASGDLQAAARWADRPLPEAPDDAPIVGLLLRSARLTVARVRLAQGHPDEAADLVASVRAALSAAPDFPELVTTEILRARAAQALNRRDSAVAALRDAVVAAAPGGYVRRFVDDGAGLASLLPAVRRDEPAFVDRLIGALSRTSGSRRPAADGRSVEGPLVEPLTGRELDVLRLMATGASNARIAEELSVSLGTAKWHVAHILAKLGASSRTEAIVRAGALGLV